MLVILLPGYESTNESEMLSLEEVIKEKGYETYAHKWPHWQDESVGFETHLETQKVFKMIQQSETEEIIIVAKSIGTFVALMLANVMQTKPKKLVLMGIPVSELTVGQQVSYPQILDKLVDTEITVIVNNHDPYGSALEVKNVMADVPHTWIEKEVDNHAYPYAEEVLAALDK